MIHVAPATVGLAFYLGSDMPWELALALPPDMPVRALSALDAAALSDLVSSLNGDVHLLVPQERRTDLDRAKDILEPLLGDGSTLKLHVSGAEAALSAPAAMVGDTAGGRVQTILPFEAQSIFSDRAAAAPASAIHTAAALIFIDTAVEGWEGIALEAARNGEVILIPAGVDPLAFITDAILAHAGASAVHIVSHGADGYLRIADTILDAAAIERASGLLAQWGAALAPGADLLLYGCNVAEDAGGVAFIEALAAATGLDVAASTDLTGATGSGGDWTLEAQAGSIETQSITVSDLTFANTLAAEDISFDSSTTHDILETTAADAGRFLFLDIDHDGDQDIIILRDAALGMVDRKYSEVLINDGSGTFTQGQTFGANVRFGEAQMVDVNGDGNLDLVARVLDGKTQVYTISTSGTLTLDTSVGFDVGTNNDATTTADIDGDGDLDILVAGAGEVRAYFNTGGTFSAGTTLFTLGTTRGAIDISVLDLDRDGNADIIVDFDTSDPATEDFSTVILKGTGTGSFTDAGRLGSVYSGGYFVFDFNHDGYDDFLFYGTALSTNSLFLNNGQIVPTAAAWNSTNWWIAETGYDFDGDGFEDLITANDTSNPTIVSWTEDAGLVSLSSLNIPVLLGNIFSAYGETSGLAGFADVNGDGKPDAIVQAYIYDWSYFAYASNTVWLLNTSADPNAAPVIQVGDANAAASEQNPVRLAPDVTLTDADGTTLASARIVITNAVAGQDQLSLDAPSGIGNITAAFDSATGTLTLTSSGATATLAEWENALEAVTYINTSNAPDVTARIITFIVNDGVSDSAAATVNLALTAVNDASVAVADTFAAAEDSTVTFAPLANDSDPDGSALAVSAINGTAIAAGQTLAVANGSVTLNADGTLTFTPTTNYNGAISFTYTASDGALSAIGAVSGTVSAVNDAPVAVADSFTATEDAAVTITPLANDSDPEGTLLAISAINGSAIATGQTVALANGSVTLNADGTLTLTPAANYDGAISFTYTVSDGSLTTNGTVSGTVGAVDDPPVAVADTITTAEDSAVTFDPLANDSDPDGSALVVSAVNGTAITAGQTLAVANGSVTLNGDGTLTFAPTANYNGAISFTYTVSDGSLSAIGAVSGTVGAVNDAPVAVADSVTTDEDTPLTFAPLINDSDPEGDPLSITAIIGPDGTAAGTGQIISLSNGTITLNADGTLTFVPRADTSGPASFTYRVSDGSNSVSGNATVVVSPVNDAPVAVADIFTAAEDSSVTFDPLANDSDPEGVALSIIAIDGTAITAGQTVSVENGGVALNGDGTLTFTPTTNYNGAVSFTYTVSDGTLTAIGTVSATVSAVNDAPSAGADGFTALEGTPLTFTPLANDSDPEGTALTIIAVDGIAIAPGGTVSLANGSITLNADSSLTFAPDDGFTGSVSFAYSISDGTLTAEGTISGTVEPRLRAQDDSFATAEDVPVLIDVFANDVEQDKDGWRITQVAGAAMAAGLSVRIDGGTVEMTEAGLLRFTPDADFNGAVAFDYAIANALSGAQWTASVQGTVTPVADAPILVSDSFAPAAGGESVVIDVLANDSDADGDLLRIVGINGTSLAEGQSTQIEGGSVVLSADGEIILTVAEDYDRPITFSYTAEDATGLRATAFVTSSGVLQAVVSDLQREFQDSGLVVDDLNDLMYIASVVAPGAFTTLDPTLVAKVTGYEAAPGYDLDIDSMSPDSVLLVRALLAIASAAGSPDLLSAQEDGSWVSPHDQSLVFQAVSGTDRAVQVIADSGTSAYDSQVSSEYAWTKEFAQQMLRSDLSASFVTSYDGHGQAKIYQSEVASGGTIGVTIAGEAARAPQSDLSNHLGTMDFVSTDGTTAVEVSRAVMTAETVGDMDDQTAIVRMRQNGMQDISVLFYAVDDYAGTIGGVRPGDADYDAASRARAYLTPDGQSWISGAGYGAYSEAQLEDVDSGDLIAMRISSGGHDFYMFAAANETVDGESVAHAWSYGLNTWGWEDLYGGGDRDFNDLVLQLDFVSAQLGLA